MPSILELIQGEIRLFEEGGVIIEQGGKTDLLWFLVEGTVEVVKAGIRAQLSFQRGRSCFGQKRQCNENYVVLCL